MENQYYWEIIERDGTSCKIPPDSVQVVQKRWGNGDPIHTTTRSIPANQIVSFRITPELFSKQPLLEATAQAFKEPILNEDGGIQVRWVKSTVTMDRWYKYYSKIPSYHPLGENTFGMKEIAFVLPTHEIDVNRTPYCSDIEIAQLTKD